MNDRGRIKWQPFLIPEHKQRIARFYDAEDDINPPEIDEQLVEKLQEVISEALNSHLEVTITYYQSKRRKFATGMIQKVDTLTRQIYLSDPLDKQTSIPFKDIGDIGIN